MATTPGKSDPEQTKRPRMEVFPHDGGKRRTTILMSPQADKDISELMRRTRQNVPGLVIADAVRLMRAFLPEFVALMFSELDKGEDQVVSICRNMMRAYYKLQAKNDTH